MNSTYNDHHHLKREPNENSGVGIIYPPSPSPLLKLNKDSHVIKKPPSPSSSSSAAAKPRQPVIIYTNTPKVIHTNPKDFMALVQKLTGMSHSEEDSSITDRGGGGKSINRSVSDLTVDRKVNRTRCGGGGGNNSYNRSYSGSGKGIFFSNICEDSESSSVITTDENMGGGGGGGEHGGGHVNSSLPYSAVAVSPFTHPPPPPPPPLPPQSMYDGTTNGINYSSYFSTLLPGGNPADSFLCGNQNFGSFDDQLYFMPNMRSSFSSSSSSGFDGLTEFRDF
ncbi:VQ motif-containing protein 20 [Raphanus sativus]|uniref:VQ motif-containing protein 20 n=1 Tax=Raphanus sativus TaxID=3726 RepID=A0A6J0JSD7_RAPSA|nr:VQ motif-containing protein 20 [Raphanus sativus]KAJ4886860.1 VQ motif-containing protein 20 [Raphanus sativus]